jgi:hypothetical protein
VNWKKICMPKKLDGLGALDLHCMNISLLLKWWWKLKDPHYNAIWKQVICAKYRDNTPLSKISPLWNDIIALNQLGQTGRATILGDDRDISCWQDRWNGDCASMSQYYHLFKLSVNPTVIVYEVLRSGGQVLQFSRTLSDILLIEFNELFILISNIFLSLARDIFCWRMSPSDKFTSHEVYE